MSITIGQKSLNCLEEGLIPIDGNYITFQDINSYCLEGVNNMPAKGSKLSDEAKAHLSIIQKGKHLSDETKLKMSIAHKGKHISKEQKKKISIATKGNTNGKAAWFKTGHQTNLGRKFPEEFGVKVSLRMKGKIVSEDVRRKMSEARKGKPGHPPSEQFINWLHTDNPSKRPEVKQKISEWHKGKHWSPATQFAKGHEGWNKGKTISDEQKRKISKTLKGHTLSTETKAKISDALKGENSPCWLGGISFIPYCFKFNAKLKECIRERDNRTCQLCGITENGRKLSIHHIHYDKPNCDPDLITLCTGCNTKVNHNREHWEAVFMELLARRGLCPLKEKEV